MHILNRVIVCIIGLFAVRLVSTQQIFRGFNSARNRPGRFPNTPVRFATSRPVPSSSFVSRASSYVQDEDEILVRRYQAGVDKKVPDIPSLSPILLGAHIRNISDKVSFINRASRIINWVTSLAREENVNRPVAELLRTSGSATVSCPWTFERCSRRMTYSRVDGRCNNLDHPYWGSSFIPLSRNVPADYDSGQSFRVVRRDFPRQTGREGSLLPSARLVSNIVHNSSPTPIETTTTMLYTNYGQALAHDMTDTPMENGHQGAKLDCCSTTAEQTSRCYSIPIPEIDFFKQFDRTCMNFFRSVETTDLNCNSGVRQQLNIASSFIDGTFIYGRTLEDVKELQGEDGHLQYSLPNSLPLQRHPHDGAFHSGINFLLAGDEKVSESPGLIGMVTVWHREHNRIAQVLGKFRKYANLPDGERDRLIYETSRKIVIAQMQHVTYNEYLRITVGRQSMIKYQLYPQTSGYFTGYNPQVNPTISNGFATAHFRFGHSMIRKHFSVVDRDFFRTRADLEMKKVFWRPNFYLFFENGFQRGVLVDSSEVCDRHMDSDLRNHMFETKPGNGLDLAALNIQRGRDHGLPDYGTFRAAASLSVPTRWSKNTNNGLKDMDVETINRFRQLYADPRDIDVWSGGVSEIRLSDAQVGPLFSEFISRQFQSLKVGDRFWYENPDVFTPGQLKEIRKISMAKILCVNIDGISKAQPKAFLKATVGGDNDRVSCSSLPEINLNWWT